MSDKGLSPGTRVAVLCKPSSDAIACMLAILRIGCIYVPLDVRLPQGRHLAMIDTCTPGLLLCHSDTYDIGLQLQSSCKSNINISDISKLSHVEGEEEVKNLARPTEPAFLLFTSGTTGVPKGILLSQANFVNNLALKTEELAIGREIVLQQSSLGFDMSIVQTFCALANGGTLVVAPRESRGDPVELSKLMLREGVTFTIATPSEYLMMLRYGIEFLKKHTSWRQVCMGGEAVTQQLVRAFQSLERPNVRLTNCYGPTEITAAATFQNIPLTSDNTGTSNGQNLVGKALPNYSVYIVDDNCQPLPIGSAGEICIGGAGVALGYLDPEQTKSKFLPDPHATAEDIAKGWSTMYRTGDKGRLLPDGTLVFLGRIDGDSQVKIRGLRIELDDVANTILKAGSGLISDAVVTVRGDPAFLSLRLCLRLERAWMRPNCSSSPKTSHCRSTWFHR
ncbi:hypothetical protein VTN77DRAFT_9271 [Rasamsonia byssochlamydoides]|uniref:uncharacterized protein n=1 Tax=Rasamsonia byssochlamydoides TaxID=89139 RepID=UPI003742D1ED